MVVYQISQETDGRVCLGATRTQGCFYSQFSYHQTQVRKKNAMKVRVAVARKQLVGIWHILSEGCTYKEYSQKKEDGES